MRSSPRLFAATALLALGGAPLCAQDETGLAQDVQELRREVQELKARLAGPEGKSVRKGFLSVGGEQILIKGRLEFELASVEPENIPAYPWVNRVQGEDFRMDSLTLWADVRFIEDVYLHTEIELRGANEDRTPGTNGDLEVALPEAYFAFENVLEHLGGLDDPLHHFLRFGAMRPWQYGLFPRHTETYGLPQTLFYRDYRVGILLGGKEANGFFYNFLVDDGHRLNLVHAGDSQNGYIPVLQDDESNQGPRNHKELELGLGWDGEVGNGLSFRAATWYRLGKLTPADKAILADTRLGLGELNSSAMKRRFGVIAAADFETDAGKASLQGEYHHARDANLTRQAWALQPSFKFLFDGVLYQERKFFSGLEFLYRFSYLEVGGEAPVRTSVPAQNLAGADLKMHTFAAILEVTQNVNLSAEYTYVDESSWGSVHNNEFLLHLGISF